MCRIFVAMQSYMWFRFYKFLRARQPRNVREEILFGPRERALRPIRCRKYRFHINLELSRQQGG